MRKLLNKPWFVATMALLALGLVGHSVWPGDQATMAASIGTASTTTSTPADTESASTDTVRLSVREALKALAIPMATNLRDPFALRVREDNPALAAEKVAVPDLVDTVHLSALWTQSGSTFILLNEHICQAGDEIGRLKIESATQEGVWLTHWKGRDFIALGGDFTLRTPANYKTATTVSTL